MRRAQPPHPGRASAKPSGPARNAVQSKWFRSPLRCGRARRNCATSHPATRVPSAVLSRGGLIRHDFSDRATTNAGLPANRRATASRSADTPSCAATALILSPRIQPSRPQSDDLVQTKGCLTEGQTRGPWSAGGGTRTLKLFRAPAPKTGMFANFITPPAVAIVPPRPPDSRAAGDVIPAHACMACLT